MMKKYRLTWEKKNAQNGKTIINTIYMKPNFPVIKESSGRKRRTKKLVKEG